MRIFLNLCVCVCLCVFGRPLLYVVCKSGHAVTILWLPLLFRNRLKIAKHQYGFRPSSWNNSDPTRRIVYEI